MNCLPSTFAKFCSKQNRLLSAISSLVARNGGYITGTLHLQFLRIIGAKMALINCNECGNQVSEKANACPKCGNPIDHPATIPSAALLTPSAPTRKSNAIWLYLVGVALISVYAGYFIQAIAGEKPRSQFANGILFWTPLFFYLLWKRRERKGWHGTLLGLGVAVVVLFAAGFI